MLELIKNSEDNNENNNRTIKISEIDEEEIELSVKLKSSELKGFNSKGQVFEADFRWQNSNIKATFIAEVET